MFSILHISDLHRSRSEPVDNDTLLAALLADCDRYIIETPMVQKPNAIIVSGDLIQGAPMGSANWQEDMHDQYRVAGKFLEQLAERFLDGDRSKLIIVPGNHDVCWNTSLSSMEEVAETEYPNDVRGALIEPGSDYRWSWKNRKLYRVVDSQIYDQRMSAYWDFIERFYEGVSLVNPIDRSRGFQLFELHDRRIIVAGFESISGNDCFSYSGAIPSGVVARCNLELRDIDHSYDLRIAVWHHSIQGPPIRDDYMEVNQVHEMIGLQFQLGLHGHQHVAAASTQYVHLSEACSMAVISAGSLCAGSQDLPRGVNRQYNVIVIDSDLRNAKIHCREMAEGEQFSRKNNGIFLDGLVNVSWQPTTDIMGRSIDTFEENTRQKILLAEEALHNNDPQTTIDILGTIDLLEQIHGHKLAIQAALQLEDWGLLERIIGDPKSIEEAVLLVTSLTYTGEFDRAEIILNEFPDIDEATVKNLEGQIEIKRELTGK